MSALLAVVVLVAWGVACPPPADVSDAGVADVDAGATDLLDVTSYCEVVAPLYCPFYLRCGRIVADDEAECVTSFLAACNARFEPTYAALAEAGLLQLSSAGVAACGAHLEDVACETQLFDLDGPCAAMWVGQQPAGTACGFDLESFVCAPGTACTLDLSLCGTCETVLVDGAACDTPGGTCARTSTCVEGVCVPRVPVGGACAPADRCIFGASCDDGVCRPRDVVGVGAACDAQRRCAISSECVAGTCVAAVPSGATCAATAPCDASGSCEQGTCVPLRAAGDGCTAAGQCASSVCTDGVCSGAPSACIPP